MKKIIKPLLLLLFVAIVISGCFFEKGGKEETSDKMTTNVTGTGTTGAPTDTENKGGEEGTGDKMTTDIIDTGTTGVSIDAEKGLSLTSGDAVLGFCVKNDRIVISTLSTGKRELAADTACSLPAQYRPDGGDVLVKFEWKYTGAYEYIGERDEQGYKISFVDKKAGMTCDMIITAREGLAGPFEIYGYLTCTGESTCLVQPDQYFTATLKKESVPTAWTFGKEGWLAEGVQKYSGEYFAGSGIRKKEIKNNTVKASCKVSSDYPNPGSLPMMYIDYGEYGLIFAQEWSSGLLTAKGKDDTLTLGAALDPNGELSTYLNSGDSMLLPSVYLGAYEGDVEVGSNIFKHWFLRYKAPECMYENENEV